LIERNTVEGELFIKFVNHGVGHVRFEIEDLMEPDSIDEVSHVLLNFSGKKLIKSCSSKFVDEILDQLRISW